MPENRDESSASSIPSTNRPIQLVIGFDFGTSFSKIIVGESRVRYAVPFEDYAIGENPYLLPSSLYVLNETKQCSLEVGSGSGVVYDNLKMPLIERDFSNEVQARAVAFMALVFQHTRNWLTNTHGSVYKDRRIEWFVNIGLPTDSFHDKELSSAYLNIAQAAWYVSEFEDEVTFSKALEVVERNDAQSSSLPDDRINVFPEFSAQLAGYVQSPRRRSGLHVVVDVGGGTLDVTVFNVYQKDGEDVYPIFDKQVKPLGVRYLVEYREQALNVAGILERSPFDDLASNASFANTLGIDMNELEQIDSQFQQKVRGAVAEVLLKSHQFYPTAPQWDPTANQYREHIPGFFCGGGVLSDFYANLLSEFETRDPPFRISAIPLPVPDDFDAPDVMSNNYSRLAVAYGLSFDPFDIGKILSIDKINYPKSNQSDYRGRYVGKEQT